MDKRFISNLFKGLASTSVGKVVTIGFHFSSILLLTRYVPQDVIGLYFLAFAIVQVLGIISGLGLDLTLSKFVSGSDDHLQQDTIATTIALRFISLTTVGLIFFASSRFILPVFDARLNECILIMIPLFVLTSFRDLFLALLQGIRKFKEYAIVEILSAASRVILLIAFHDRLSLQNLLYIEIASQTVEVVLQLIFLRAFLFNLSFGNIKTETIRSISQFSTPLYINNLLVAILDRGNVFLIGALLTPLSVAAYEVANKIPDGFTRLFSSFIIVYFPTLSNLFTKGSREDAKKLMNNSLVLLSTGIIFLVLVSFLFAEKIVLLLFSEEYLEISLAFVLLMLNFYLRAISNIMGYSLVAAGNSSAPVKANIVASILNIVGSLVLIQIFGYIGAVYSLLLMNITTQIIYVLFLRQAQLAPNLLAYLKPFFLLIVTISIYQLFGPVSILLKLLLVGLYIGACWIFIKEMREFLHSALGYINISKIGTFFWHTPSKERENVSKN